MAGSLATALGALFGGFVTQALQHASVTPVASYLSVVIVYAIFGAVLGFLFARLSAHVEVDPAHDSTVGTGTTRFFGLTQSRGMVLKLSSLFALDSTLVLSSFVQYDTESQNSGTNH